MTTGRRGDARFRVQTVSGASRCTTESFGEVSHAEIVFPDGASAVVLKAFATKVRSRDTDVSDVWRCLEVALVAEVSVDDFATGEAAEEAAILRSLFTGRDGPAMWASALALSHVGVTASRKADRRMRWRRRRGACGCPGPGTSDRWGRRSV